MAKLDSDIETLRRVPLFTGFGTDELRLLAFSAEDRTLSDGEQLFAQGDRADGGYVVAHGRLDLTESADSLGERVVAALGPGSLIGELALIVETTRAVHAYATAGTRVLLIRRAAFKRVLTEYPVLAGQLYGVIARRIQATASDLDRVRLALERIDG
jgi:CRP-like cAMP-binding protein